MTKRVFLNSVSSTALFLVNIAIAFIMSPVIVRSLGNRDYGIWEMLLSFCGYLGILELGIGPAIVRFIARETALNNKEGLNHLFNSALWGLLFIGGLCLAVMALLSFFPERILNLKPGAVLHLEVLFIIVGANLSVQFPGILFTGYLMGCQRHFLINTFRIFFYITQAFIIYQALTKWEGSGLLWVALISFCGSLVQYSFFSSFVFYRNKDLKFGRCFMSWRSLKELYSFGLNSTLLMVSDRIQRQSLPIVIGHVLGVSEVVFFAMPNKLAAYAKGLILSVGMPLTPYFSTIDAKRNPDEPMKEWFPISLALMLIALPAALILLSLGEKFLHIWIGGEYAERGRYVVVFLAASLFASGLVPNSKRVLVAAGQHGPPARWILISSIFSVGLTIFLTSYWGISGAACGFTLGDMAAVLICWFYASRYTGISIHQHLKTTFKPLVGPLLILFICLWMGTLYFDDLSYGSLIKTGGLSMMLYVVSVWFMTLQPTHRQAIRIRLAEARNVFHSQI